MSRNCNLNSAKPQQQTFHCCSCRNHLAKKHSSELCSQSSIKRQQREYPDWYRWNDELTTEVSPKVQSTEPKFSRPFRTLNMTLFRLQCLLVKHTRNIENSWPAFLTPRVSQIVKKTKSTASNFFPELLLENITI